MLTFGSLFTGVGGFDLGFEHAGIKCVWQCEIDKFANQVLNRRWKEVKKFQDVRNVGKNSAEQVDIIIGGFPCQDVSVAGRRAGFAGERSGLWFEFARVISELKPRWAVIENVPGLLSSNRGRDFEAVLGTLVEFGYGVSWRIFDAQYFGVSQRRRRVFIVGSFGNGRAAEILFERKGLRGDFEPSRKERAEYSRAIANCITTREGQRLNETIETLIPVMMTSHYGTGGNNTAFVGVRRLTPVECCRLQGFPDDWNDNVSDTQRYKQMGNAVCVNVAEWIGKRIVESEER